VSPQKREFDGVADARDGFTDAPFKATLAGNSLLLRVVKCQEALGLEGFPLCFDDPPTCDGTGTNPDPSTIFLGVLHGEKVGRG
jgi:hypothetical protein